MENSNRQIMTAETFAGLGGGKVAYVRSLKSDQAKSLFPGLPPVAPDLELWALLGAVVYVALWPAMWVDPLGTLQKIAAVSGEYAVEGHSNPLFFLGDIINGDPGLRYYPLTWLWRSTPIVLVGLLLSLLAGARFVGVRTIASLRRWRVEEQTPTGYALLSLVVMAVLFTLLMNLSAKKKNLIIKQLKNS